MSVRRFQTVRTLAAIAMVAGSTLFAIAQQPPSPTRVRGTIEAVDGDVLAVKSRGGEDFRLHMTGDLRVVGITKISLSDIKVGAFIVAEGTQRTDGSLDAVRVASGFHGPDGHGGHGPGDNDDDNGTNPNASPAPSSTPG